MKNAVQQIVDKLPKLRVAMSQLTTSDVLVGVPSDKTARKGDPINNATIAYLMDKGSPAQNIPARPFMEPGVEAAKDKIIEQLKRAAQNALSADDGAIEKGLIRSGMIAQSSIRMLINSGIDPALSPSTLAARRRRGRKGTVALIDTGQLRNSINFVIRKK